MPKNWEALKCEGCGTPLIPVSDVPGLLYTYSQDMMEELKHIAERMEKMPFSKMPIIAGSDVEFIKSPLSDLLRCPGCGMLYERVGE